MPPAFHEQHTPRPQSRVAKIRSSKSLVPMTGDQNLQITMESLFQESHAEVVPKSSNTIKKITADE